MRLQQCSRIINKNMIKIINVTKKYKNNEVLKGLNLELRENEITALVGKNGAGKTTLIRILAGVLKADSGVILNNDVNKVGILLGGDINLYDNLSVYETLVFFGQINGMSRDEIKTRINEIDEVLEIKAFLKKRANELSRGMKQKVALSISTIADPDVLLLDEPSTGLDIEACTDVIKFLRHEKEKKKTVLVATHNIFEISDLSDRIAFIKNGIINVNVKTKDFFSNCEGSDKGKLLAREM